MKVAVFGLGYVGSVSAACLAEAGHNIIGIDSDLYKVKIIRSGRSPLIEKGLNELIAKGINTKKIEVTTNPRRAVLDSDVALICVGTPSLDHGGINLEYVERVTQQIGEALRERNSFYTIAVRSTVLPGTLAKLGKIVSEISGKVPEKEFSMAVNPEFLREGSAIDDFRNPPYTLIGTDDENARTILRSLYTHIDAPIIMESVNMAEMFKYVNNTWHALKIAFANEIGSICKYSGIDSHRVIKLFALDTKLNISSAYLKPGFAFGGSCLPKEIRALSHYALELGVFTPLINHIIDSNEGHIARVIAMINKKNVRRIGWIGLSFKEGTDDLRESPALHSVQMLLRLGYDVLIYDDIVVKSRLIGTNKRYLENNLPHINKILTDDFDRVREHAELLVVTHASSELSHKIEETRKKGTQILDLIRYKGANTNKECYEGICW